MSSKHYEHFIRWVQDRLGDHPRIRDKQAVARLKRADSPEQAPYAWEILIRLAIPDRHFPICLLVGAAMCRRGIPHDGSASLGRALLACYNKEEPKDQADMRLRRLLGCESSEELCLVLRPLLSFIDSRTKVQLSYARLLDELVRFDTPVGKERIKLQWVQDFWGLAQKEEEAA